MLAFVGFGRVPFHMGKDLNRIHRGALNIKNHFRFLVSIIFNPSCQFLNECYVTLPQKIVDKGCAF